MNPSMEPQQTKPRAKQGRFLGRLGRLLAWLSPAALLLWAALCMTALGRVVARPLIHLDTPAKADFIVVLGGNVERVVEAANLYRQGLAPKVIVTSGAQSAAEMAELARAYGVAPEDVLIDGAAGRTADHPRTIQSVAGVRPESRLIVVTSALHTSRSKACFERQGYTNVMMTCPQWHMMQVYGPRETFWGYQPDWFWAVYEWSAWAMYKVRGWA